MIFLGLLCSLGKVSVHMNCLLEVLVREVEEELLTLAVVQDYGVGVHPAVEVESTYGKV